VNDVRVSIPHVAIEFMSLPGIGGAVNITLSVGGQLAAMAASAVVQYAPPIVTGLHVVLDSFSSAGLDCSGLLGGVSQSAINLEIVGRNFGGVGSASDVAVSISGVVHTVNVTASSHTTLRVVTHACDGEVLVLVASQASNGFRYRYGDLMSAPVITAVVPLHGPVAGGTNVTLVGSYFQYSGVVMFDMRDGSSRECRTQGVVGASYNDTHIR
jgi:hypothetical protein